MQSFHRWPKMPGRVDDQNMGYTWAATNAHDLPDLPAYTGAIPAQLIPYRRRLRTESGRAPAGAALHFFLDDYRFETVWTRPEKAWEYVQRYRVALGPDFSLWPEMPYPVRLHQLYKNRWCCRLWAARGIDVIPAVTWADRPSLIYSFDGLPRDSVVALGTLGVDDWQLFDYGYNAMLERINPAAILVYGTTLPSQYRTDNVYFYPYQWGDFGGRVINDGR